MFYYLYEIRNKINGKIYVGVHKTKNINDGYMGSGKIIKAAIQKHGIENFKKVILETFENAEAMYTKEKEIVNEEFLAREDVYNLRCGGSGGFDYIHKINPHPFKGHKHTVNAKIKIGKIAKNRHHTDESKLLMKMNNWARQNPEEQRTYARLAALKSVKNRTEETIDKLSKSVTKYWETITEEICPYCSTSGRGGIMKRWHYDNCKYKY